MVISFKNRVVVWYILFIVGMTSGCSPDALETDDESKADLTSVSERDMEKEAVPDINKIKNICELSTLRCYYHNVAKSTKESGTGIFHFGEKERIFWIEYTGIVEISFDSEMIKMESDGTKIALTLPQPRVTCTVDQDSWNEDSYVISKDQYFQKNPITAADQTRAIEEAQKKLKEEVGNNSALLGTAKQQARELIENYINQIGSAAGMKYSVVWEEEDRE